MSDTGLTINTVKHPGGIVVTPSGDIDLTAAPLLKSELKKAQSISAERLILDLGDVPYMDSSGLATLVEAMQTSRRTGKKLILCSLSPRVRAIFEIAKMQMVFTIVGSVDEALVK